ncbi:MAG: hypothetical protein KDA61_10955 [Planctomycetales bacterium]|nr:hypothetical protein [Planctomycetales bacterium]
MPTRHTLGGVIHAYQKYDPQRFPSPTQPPPDLVSSAFDHLLAFGTRRELTPEELARAVRLDPSQIAGLGPSIDALLALLRERKRKILERYETRKVLRKAHEAYRRDAADVRPPRELRDRWRRAVKTEQIRDLERLWYAVGDDQAPFAGAILRVVEALGNKYEIDELAAQYEFVGRESMTIPQALQIKEELAKIDELIRQLEEARETAQIGIVDLEMLAEFTEPGDIDQLSALQQQVQDLLREMARQQGLEESGGSFHLTPKAYRIFQGKLLERLFSELSSSRTGRHRADLSGEGPVEMQAVKPYEFGDALTHIDIPGTFVNALVRNGPGLPVRIEPRDIEVHRTRNNPKCATCVVMDMSGSMRYDGQYMNVKRMALALQGLITSEYPGDVLRFIEMYTFAKLRSASEIIELMPKPVTIHDPWVHLRVDMSRDDISEQQIHPHFTNIQHALRLSRQNLVNVDTPNKQIVLITDGLPTAHFEDSLLYMFYPPDPRTEQATMREAALCQREGIVINIFLVPSWSQSEEDIRFAYRLAEDTKGRVFFTAGKDLDRFVVWDYLDRKREILG